MISNVHINFNKINIGKLFCYLFLMPLMLFPFLEISSEEIFETKKTTNINKKNKSDFNTIEINR